MDETNDSDRIWPYLLAGYVLGFLLARLLVQRIDPGEKVGAFFGGLGLAVSGGSLGKPWRA